MRRIAQEQNFSVKAFCAWAKENDVLKTNNKKNQQVLKINGSFQRFYSIKQELVEDITDWVEASIEIPFD